MKTYGGVEVQLQAFLTLAQDGSEWSALRPSRLIPGQTAPGTLWTEDWVGSRAYLDMMGKESSLTGFTPWLPGYYPIT